MKVTKFDSYSAAAAALVKKLKNRKVDLKVKHIVLTPDNYTFAFERMIFDGGGAFDVEVTSPGRLYLRYASEKKELSREGAVMLIKKIALENRNKLKCFGRSCLRTGFALKTYELINSLMSAGTSPQDFGSKTGESVKYADISLIYKEFLLACGDKAATPSGRIKALAPFIDKIFRGAHVYAVNFDYLSAEVKKFFAAVSAVSAGFEFYASEVKKSFNLVKKPFICSFPDAVTQAKEAALNIRNAMLNGVSADKICLIINPADAPLIKRVFTEYGVAVYTGEKRSLKSFELSRFVLYALRAAASNCRAEEVLLFAKNSFTGIQKSDSDAFERYVNQKCVDFSFFKTPFTIKENEQNEFFAGAERARLKVNELLYLLNGISSVNKSADMVKRIKLLLDKAGCKKRLDETDNELDSQTYQKVIDVLEIFENTFTAEADFDTLSDTLEEGFNSVTVADIPNRRNAVTAGEPGLFRGQKFEKTVVLSFNDGILPVVSGDGGLLQPFEVEEINGKGIELRPTSSEKAAISRDELWKILLSSEEINLYYIDDGVYKPAYDLTLIMKNNPPFTYQQLMRKTLEAGADLRKKEKDEKLILSRFSSAPYALEFLQQHTDFRLFNEIYTAIGKDYSQLFCNEKEEKPLKKAAELFMPMHKTSVSALQTYFSCPYMYFLQYGLKIKKAEDGTVSRIDIGNVLHRVVEKYVSQKMPKDYKTAAARIVSEEMKEEKFSYENNSAIVATVKEEAKKLCGAIYRQNAAGKFVPMWEEKEFGEKSDLVPVSFDTESGNVSLYGFIDRVDKYNGFVRVIDYKTGESDFRFDKLYYGTKIQLMIYMRTLIINKFRPAGMFYFPLSTSWDDDSYSYRLKGVYNKDAELLSAADEKITRNEKSDVIEYNSERMGVKACTEDQLNALALYAEKVAGNAVKDIVGGRISPSPVSFSGKTPCAYCDFAAVCGKKDKNRRTAYDAGKDVIAAAAAKE